MTLQQLRCFIEVVNAGSINSAAARLFVEQTSLSSSIKKLENEIGLELFYRTPRGIKLTDSGVEFLGYARQIVEQTGLLEERYLQQKPPRRLCAISAQSLTRKAMDQPRNISFFYIFMLE